MFNLPIFDGRSGINIVRIQRIVSFKCDVLMTRLAKYSLSQGSNIIVFIKMAILPPNLGDLDLVSHQLSDINIII